MATDTLNGQSLKYESLSKHYIDGLKQGAIVGAVFGGGSAIVNPQSSRLAASFSKHPLIYSTVTGAVAFPFAKTVLEASEKQPGTNEDKEGFLIKLGKNYNFSNIARGAIIGFGLGYGFSKGPELWRGILSKNTAFDSVAIRTRMIEGARLENRAVSGSEIWSTLTKQYIATKAPETISKLVYGGIVGLAAGSGGDLARAGVDWLRSDVNADYLKPNWGTRVMLDAVGYFALGSLTGVYASMQGKGIISGLKEYSLTAAPQETKAMFGLFNFGKANGSQLLLNRAQAGAIDWTLVSPAMLGGSFFWGSVKAKAGYYSEEARFGSNKSMIEGVNLLKPGTWIMKGPEANQFENLTGRKLFESGLTGPRSGLWMKPMIELFQVKADNPTWYNQGGVAEKAYNFGRWLKSVGKDGGESFKIASWEGTASQVKAALGAAKWMDSNILYMPGFVTGIDSAIGAVDKQLVLWSGIESDKYISDGVRAYAKWLPFFMVSSFAPDKDDMLLADVYRRLGAGERFTQEKFDNFSQARAEVKAAGGLTQALRTSARLQAEVAGNVNKVAVEYLKSKGINSAEERRAI
ncbi:MAG: hypothetical protein NTY47_03140, partial [Candidatus Omnitrophica bacterium]|nr:hypothetical protein [Candidatus Omnitrophota bacterium]